MKTRCVRCNAERPHRSASIEPWLRRLLVDMALRMKHWRLLPGSAQSCCRQQLAATAPKRQGPAHEAQENASICLTWSMLARDALSLWLQMWPERPNCVRETPTKTRMLFGRAAGAKRLRFTTARHARGWIHRWPEQTKGTRRMGHLTVGTQPPPLRKHVKIPRSA